MQALKPRQTSYTTATTSGMFIFSPLLEVAVRLFPSAAVLTLLLQATAARAVNQFLQANCGQQRHRVPDGLHSPAE